MYGYDQISKKLGYVKLKATETRLNFIMQIKENKWDLIKLKFCQRVANVVIKMWKVAKRMNNADHVHKNSRIYRHGKLIIKINNIMPILYKAQKPT